MNTHELKAEVAAYLRFVRQYHLVCFEQLGQDVIAVDSRRRMMWIELKVSIADLLNDRRKQFHQSERLRRGLEPFKVPGAKRGYANHLEWDDLAPARFFFAVPYEIEEKALAKVEALYPWAGLLSVEPMPRVYFGHGVKLVRRAEQLHDRKLAVKLCIRLVKAQSASLANFAAKYSRRMACNDHDDNGTAKAKADA